jgi:hypothetical protein
VVARAVAGPVVVVRAPGQELRELPDGAGTVDLTGPVPTYANIPVTARSSRASSRSSSSRSRVMLRPTVRSRGWIDSSESMAR